MRFLVFSDSHGCTAPLLSACQSHPDIRHVLFLGDGYDDIAALQAALLDVQIIGVKGNCDPSSCPLPPLRLLEIENIRLMLTHGHQYGVKFGLEGLKKAAGDHHARVVLFGHTHVPMDTYQNGAYFFNPGSIAQNNKNYGVLEITQKAVLFGQPKG